MGKSCFAVATLQIGSIFLEAKVIDVHSHKLCPFPLPSARQRPSYDDCLEVKREYYQNSSVLDCVTQCSQSAAHLCEQQIGFVTLGPLRCCLLYTSDAADE